MSSNIQHLRFTVDDTNHGERIGKFLSKNYRHVIKSRARLHRAFKRNEITVNGETIEETKVLNKGDVVEIKYDDSEEEKTQMKSIPIRICYEDEYLAIVWKPSGQNFILFEKAIHFNTALKDVHGNRQKVWCINDIQKAASGLILVAKTEEIRDLLQQKYQNNEIQITMRLLCHGAIETTNPDDLFTAEIRGKKDQDAEPIVPSQILKEMKIISKTPSNNAQFITRLDLELSTPLSSSKLRSLFFHQSNHPIVGNSKYTRPLKVNDKGLCAALISISFTHPKLVDTLVQVHETEPAKFKVLCDREARFYQLKIDKEMEEIKQAGIMDTAERKEGQLLAYMLGQKQFCGHMFKITKDCLIPRTSSESLVQAAVDILQSITETPSIIDVGTGCGNLLISILSRVPLAKGVGIDISQGALNVAQENASNLIPGRTVEWRNQDMATLDDTNAFDVLVCNPPYLDANKVGKRRDHKDLVEQEPSEALFAENEGYQWYQVLSQLADNVLKENGVVVLECGKGMIDNVCEIWSEWERVDIYKDSQGWDRCLVLKRKNQ